MKKLEFMKMQVIITSFKFVERQANFEEDRT